MTNSVPVQGIRYKLLASESDGFVDNIREQPVAKAFMTCDINATRKAMIQQLETGRDSTFRDRNTGETLLHVFCEQPHFYTYGQVMCYLLGSRIDLDIQDPNGDTVLHKVCRYTGGYTCIIALFRCGASPKIRNNHGRTPGEDILHYKRPGWQENLHWYNKFYPGLWEAVRSEKPDAAHIERLLRYWSRTMKAVGNQVWNLKCLINRKGGSHLDLICIVEKYENTNELALSMLAGKAQCSFNWNDPNVLPKLNVNTKDYSYQYHWRDYPTAPRPLLAALWSIAEPPAMERFLDLHPDTAAKYTFESESSSPPKPLFFLLVNPKCRPANVKVTSLVLQASDLNIRNTSGQTVLIEAMYSGETEEVIQAILDAGVDISARDGLGLTARDHATLLDNDIYRKLLKDHVTKLVTSCEYLRVQSMVLQLYEIVCPPANHRRIHVKKILLNKNARNMRQVLGTRTAVQENVNALFQLVKTGNKTQLMTLAAHKYGGARDKAGCSLLHRAVQYSSLCRHTKPRLLTASCKDGDSSAFNNRKQTRATPHRETIITGNPVDPRRYTSTHGLHPELEVECSELIESNRSFNLPEVPYEYNSDHKTLFSQHLQDDINPGLFAGNGNDNSLLEENIFSNSQSFYHIRPISQSLEQVQFKKKLTNTNNLGTIAFLLVSFPNLLSSTNNLGQTPLHYAHIFDASHDVIRALELAGASSNTKDVFDLEPEDYSRRLHGMQTHQVRRQATVELDLKIFLQETNFKDSFAAAIQAGDEATVKKLATQLLERGGESMFRSALFDCLDCGLLDVAHWLVMNGFSTNITKQYETCNPDDPMCAMMECSHPVTSLRKRAEEVGATSLVAHIDNETTSSKTTTVTTTNTKVRVSLSDSLLNDRRDSRSSENSHDSGSAQDSVQTSCSTDDRRDRLNSWDSSDSGNSSKHSGDVQF